MRTWLVILVAACGHAPSGSQIDAASAGDSTGQPDAADPACASIVCDDPPATACVAGGVLRTYALPGTCSAGVCGYAEMDRQCVGACNAARCAGGWGTFAQQNAPGARYDHSAVWTGSEMIVWGGAVSSVDSYGDGARYDPVHGTWHAISQTNAPGARRDHSAVWTGTEMIVWGGTDITQGDGAADGGRYNPATDTWTYLPAAGAPAGRFAHTAVWTGSEMIVWGGAASSVDSYGDGARFDPVHNTWHAISHVNAPGARRDHSAVWTGTEMIVFGGSGISAGYPANDVHAYNPATDTWRTITTTHTPAARFGHAAVWTGNEMIVWGGAASSTGTYGDGARLDVGTGVWTALPTSNEPGAARQLPAVWSGSAMLMWGGSSILDGGNVYDTGAQYALYH